MPAGDEVASLEAAADPVAAFLEVREVRVARDPANARYAAVTVVRRDPLADMGAQPWPNLTAAQLSVWEPIPVGCDEHGLAVALSLVERNVLIGGEPGGGKSVALSMLLATAALDPSCELHLFDGKYVELAPWAGCATHAVGPNLDEAIDVLRWLVAEMDDRYTGLLANRARKVRRQDGWPLHVVAVDEKAFYLNTEDRADNKLAGQLMRDLASRGRAAGVILLGCTQKPSGDTIPTFLRDLYAIRWAFRCTTPQMSDTILGQGWAAAGYTASGIDVAQRGTGYLLHEGAEPVRLRTFYLTDDDLHTLALRAEAVRAAYAQAARFPSPAGRRDLLGIGPATDPGDPGQGSEPGEPQAG
jgi:hypothetical protein